MTAYLIVRATVPKTERQAFEKWYQDEHLPDAKTAFSALSAFRGWASGEENTHYAIYEFPDLEKARAILNSEALQTMVAEFDRNWQDRVVRTREIIEIAQRL